MISRRQSKKRDQCEFLHEYDMSKKPECYFYSRFNLFIGVCLFKELIHANQWMIMVAFVLSEAKAFSRVLFLSARPRQRRD